MPTPLLSPWWTSYQAHTACESEWMIPSSPDENACAAMYCAHIMFVIALMLLRVGVGLAQVLLDQLHRLPATAACAEASARG